MGLIQFSRQWDRQPPIGVGHNREWSRRGMVALFDCRSGVELISGARASVDGLQRLASTEGSAADFGSTANMRWAHRAEFAQTGPMSIMVLCDVDALTGYGALIAKQGTTTTNAPYELRLGVSPTDSKINILRANAASFGTRALPANIISAGSRGVALCISVSGRDPNGFAYIRGGSDVTSGGLFAGTGTGDVSDNGADVWIGRRYDGATQLDGRIYYVALFNRNVYQSEAVEWASNKWSLFEPRRILVPVSAGGGITYTFSASGSVAFSGASPMTRGYILLPSGVVAFSGSSPFTVTGAVSYTFSASGGVLFSGAVPLAIGRVFLPSGVVAFSGTSPFSSGSATSYTFGASGGFTLSGTSLASRGRVFDASGTVNFSGAALWEKSFSLSASGYVYFSGSAGMYYTSGLASNTVDRLLKGYGV